MTLCHTLYSVTSYLRHHCKLLIATSCQHNRKVLVETTITRAHRLLSAFSWCLFTWCLFTPAMNSSIDEADAQISTGSKSTTSKLTGSWPCMIVPILMSLWQRKPQTLRQTQKLPACTNYILHDQNNTTIAVNLDIKWISQLPQACFMLCGTRRHLRAQCTKLAAVTFGVQSMHCWYQKYICSINSFCSLFCIQVCSKMLWFSM